MLALQRMLGHKSAKVTLDTYADLFDDDLDAIAITLNSRYSRENAATGWLMSTYSKSTNCHLDALTTVQLWRWRRDLNPRTGVTRHTLSRRAP